MHQCDASGADGEEVVWALATAISRVICDEAPDRQTAEHWHGMADEVVDVSLAHCDADGSASWSRARMH